MSFFGILKKNFTSFLPLIVQILVWLEASKVSPVIVYSCINPSKFQAKQNLSHPIIDPIWDTFKESLPIDGTRSALNAASLSAV